MLHNAGELTVVGSDMTPEQQARVNIDSLLEQAGWAVQDVGSVNLYAGAGVAVREFQGFTTPDEGRKITEQGSTVEAGYYVDRRDRLTRKVRWEQLEEELTYAPNQLDRDVVAVDQIRTVIQTFRDRLFTEMFPNRSRQPPRPAGPPPDPPGTARPSKPLLTARRSSPSSPVWSTPRTRTPLWTPPGRRRGRTTRPSRRSPRPGNVCWRVLPCRSPRTPTCGSDWWTSLGKRHRKR